MTPYKIYVTVELPGQYTQLETARMSAVRKLQTLTADKLSGLPIVQVRVFEENKVLSGERHAFTVDMMDGCA